ncbi:MAG: protein kinase [Gemmataceae bacterium]|nr:protein kinase [Gemmataceae bacterium]
MTPCPPPDQLKQLLAEALGATERAAVETHVESCTLCQERLQQLACADKPLSLSHAAGIGQAPAEETGRLSEHDEARLERMKKVPPPRRPGPALQANGATALPEIPGYEMLAVLGHGAAGVVYKARHLQLNRLVALKMILGAEHERPEDRLRFRIEGELIARLHHPNIVQIHEVGSHAGRLFFALEFVDGGSLADRLDGTPQPPHQAAELIEALARAVHAAHLQGIVHRDLKPANILLAATKNPGGSSDRGRQATAYGVPMIADFGLAKQLQSDVRLTQSGAVVGTPRYMAPEQCRGDLQAIGPATDVYALGTTLYELLTGRAPFPSEEVVKVLHQVVEEEPWPPRRLRPNLPRDLECITLRCLEKEPGRRYASAEALADDLRRFLDGEPIRARRVGRLERAWKWARRRPVIAALLLGLVLVAGLGVAGVTTAMVYAFAGWEQAQAQKQEAVRAWDDARTAHDESQGLSARLTLDKGLALAEQGDVARGLHWMARALEVAPADAVHFQELVRVNLAAWNAQVHRLHHLLEHPDEVWAVALSPDGQTLVTGGADGRARRWDVATGRLLGQPMQTPGWVWSVAYSPDGKNLATAGGNWKSDGNDSGCGVQLWDAATGAPIGPPLPHTKAVWSVAFSPNGRVLASAGNWSSVRLWDVASGQRLVTLEHSTPEVKSVAFSSDGRLLASGNHDRTVCVWDAATGRRLHTLRGHTAEVRGVAFHPDSRRLASCSWDSTVRFWDAGTGQAVGQPLAHPHSVDALAFSPDGASLVTGCWDGSARLWDVATGRPAGSLLRHRLRVGVVAISGDGRTLVTGSIDRTARLWEVSRSLARHADAALRRPMGSADQPIPLGTSPRLFFSRVAFSPDRKTVLTGSGGGIAQLWQAATGGPQTTPLEHPGDRIRALAFSPDGSMVATVCQGPRPDRMARVWETATGRPLTPWLPHTGSVPAFAFSPDGRLLATGDYDQRVHLWDVATGQRRGEPFFLHDLVECVAFSPDGKTLAVGTGNTRSRDPQVRLYDVGTGQLRSEPMRHRHWVVLVAFSLDGKTLLTAAKDSTARLWDAATGRPLSPPLPHAVAWTSAAWSPDSKAILTGGGDGTARLWDAANGRPLSPPLTHPAPVKSVAFSPDGRTLLIGCEGGSARLWDTVTFIPLGPPLVLGAELLGLTFTADGRSFLTTTVSWSARVWPVPAPPAADWKHLALRLQVDTALAMDAGGQAVTPLDAEAWQEHRQRLVAQGGTAEETLAVPVSVSEWHDARARDAEQDGDAFAALWHLDRLLALQPADWLLYARRARVQTSEGRFELAARDYRRAQELGAGDRLRVWYAYRAVECRLRGHGAAAEWYAQRRSAARKGEAADLHKSLENDRFVP